MPDEAPSENLEAQAEPAASGEVRSSGDVLHARMDGLERTIEKLLEHPEKLADRFGKLLSIVEILAESHAEVRHDFRKLQKEYEEFRKRTEEALRSLADNQQSGEDRLHAMVTIVDGLIRKSPPEPPRAGSAGV